ncbi:MAG: hypothetical protein HKO96_03090 [Flavobacteriaceae bacterium]|nr:hypothetical protein [Bacteroidia bacterium]NNK69437.1 hypothetical protein [Flavobacteriaceae bacterium]
MKPNFKLTLILLSLFALISFQSCQNEVLEETQNQEETINAGSEVASLMRSTAANSGTMDNILDGTDCFSINLPVTIIANGITITIDSLEDLEVLEEIFDEFQDDDDILEFLFPITIVLNDYTEITIENEDELEAFIEECTEVEDDVIECVDFVYPISFSIYNSAFQIIDTVVIEDDEALYDFLEELEDNPAGGAIIASLNYPVTLIYSDGSTVEVNSNQELQAAISTADGFCEDDDEYDCDLEDVEMYLLECVWQVESFNGDDNLQAYAITFNEDGTLTISEGSTTNAITGLWEISESDAGLVLSITELTALDEDLGGDWLIMYCEEDEIKLVHENSTGAATYVILDRNCEDDPDCSAQQVVNSLVECVWHSGTNVINTDYIGVFNFDPSGVFTVETPNGTVISGQWGIALTDQGTYLILEVGGDYAELSGEWELYECEEGRIKFINGDQYIVFEQDCENDFYCEDLQLSIGDECETADGIVGVVNENCECETDNTEFDCPELEANVGDACTTDTGSEGYVSENCECVEETVEYDCPDYQSNIGDPCENPNGVSGVLDENCNCVTDTAYDCPDLQANFGDDCEDANGNIGFINENCGCEVETNPFECFSAVEFVICDDGDVYDGFTAFDLNLAFPNCPTDEMEITFHASLADAELGVEALASPYVNTVNPQTIFARVQLAGTTEYEVFPVHLFVENCNPDPCTIGAIEDYLLTCGWIPVSVDGSDDFSTVYLDFQENGVLVAEGLGLVSEGNWELVGNASTGVYLIISGFNNQFQVFIGEWLVAQCTPTELILINNANDNQVLLQQECN